MSSFWRRVNGSHFKSGTKSRLLLRRLERTFPNTSAMVVWLVSCLVQLGVNWDIRTHFSVQNERRSKLSSLMDQRKFHIIFKLQVSIIQNSKIHCKTELNFSSNTLLYLWLIKYDNPNNSRLKNIKRYSFENLHRLQMRLILIFLTLPS